MEDRRVQKWPYFNFLAISLFKVLWFEKLNKKLKNIFHVFRRTIHAISNARQMWGILPASFFLHPTADNITCIEWCNEYHRNCRCHRDQCYHILPVISSHCTCNIQKILIEYITGRMPSKSWFCLYVIAFSLLCILSFLFYTKS